MVDEAAGVVAGAVVLPVADPVVVRGVVVVGAVVVGAVVVGVVVVGVVVPGDVVVGGVVVGAVVVGAVVVGEVVVGSARPGASVGADVEVVPRAGAASVVGSAVGSVVGSVVATDVVGSGSSAVAVADGTVPGPVVPAPVGAAVEVTGATGVPTELEDGGWTTVPLVGVVGTVLAAGDPLKGGAAARGASTGSEVTGEAAASRVNPPAAAAPSPSATAGAATRRRNRRARGRRVTRTGGAGGMTSAGVMSGWGPVSACRP